MVYHDCYSEEVIDNQALLFERAVLSGYDMKEFIEGYLNSAVRERIDWRYAKDCNYLDTELLEVFEKERKLKKSQVSFDFMLANWIGFFYAYVQDYLWISSKEVLKRFPAKWVISKANALHDYDIDLVIKKILGGTNL